MTSNVGAADVKTGKGLGFVLEGSESQYNVLKGKLMDTLKHTFNPEFLNRLDEAIVFRPLVRGDMNAILDILLRNFTKRLSVLELRIDFTAGAKEFLIQEGFDPALGARPIKRAIQRHLEDPLSELMLKQGVNRDAEIHVDAEAGKLTFHVVSRTTKEDA
jgi:ATP-dependent Clp protease ATP-binding subunit ClpC